MKTKMNHRQKLKLARQLMNDEERKKNISPWDCRAWIIRAYQRWLNQHNEWVRAHPEMAKARKTRKKENE